MPASTMRAHHSIATRWKLDTPLEVWQDEANCQGRYDLPWTSDSRPAIEDLAEMAEICADCPVRRACGKFALDQPDQGGVYAGVYLTWRPVGRSEREIWYRQRAMLRDRLLADMSTTGEPR